MLESCAIALIATGIEAAVGYPDALFARIGHPVTWIGALIQRLDAKLNRPRDAPERRRAAGFFALALILAATGAIALLLQYCLLGLPDVLALGLLGLAASTGLAQRSLDAHVRAVRDALRGAGLPAARAAVSKIVGRDTAGLDEAGIARAAIESLAENFADGIVAPVFYLALAGLPGGLLYKAVNTADSMIGHRTPRYEAFGFAAAKLDDIVNWPAARLAALWIVGAAVLCPGASPAAAWRITRRDARGHASPNAGWPEAAMAGALGIRLGGPRIYAGLSVADTPIGEGETPDAATIDRALTLYRVACAVNAGAVALALVVAVLVSARAG